MTHAVDTLANLVESIKTLSQDTKINKIVIKCDGEDTKHKVNTHLLTTFPDAGKMQFTDPYFGVIVELGGPPKVTVTSLLLNILHPCNTRGDTVYQIAYMENLPVANPVNVVLLDN